MGIDRISTSNYRNKPIQYVPYVEKKNWLDRHVEWLKTDHGKVVNRAKKALVAIELVFASLSVIGLFLISQGVKKARRLESVKRFYQEVQKISPPRVDLSIEMKTAKASFNHVQEFVIKHGVIWERKRHSKDAWTPIYFDGYPKGVKPFALHADGANLIVLDKRGDVHYKKVLHEYRVSDLLNTKHKAANYGRTLLKKAGIKLNEHSPIAYVAVDKATKNNWKEQWFSIPIAGAIVNLFDGKRLKLPKDIRAWSISHRGAYNNYYEDASNRKHPMSTGVTTLYVLSANGKEVYKFDPWSPIYADMSITLPEDSKHHFEALNLSASSSTLMVVGYETSSAEKGQGTISVLKVKTKLADIDTEGWNPGLKYSYFPENERNPKKRALPMPTWQDHPLHLKEGEAVTKNITIFQTGEGNKAREMRIEGKGYFENELRIGYFYKSLADEKWNFTPYESTQKTKLVFLAQTKSAKNGIFKVVVKDYEADSYKFNQLSQNNYPTSMKLMNFGIGTSDSRILLKHNGKEYSFLLHRKKTLKNFLGLKGDAFDLVIPKEYHQDPWIMKMMKGKWVQEVKYKMRASRVTFEGTNFKWNFIPQTH